MNRNDKLELERLSLFISINSKNSLWPWLSGQVIESEGLFQEWQLIPTGTPMHRIWNRIC
jgi:hypothetical protein